MHATAQPLTSFASATGRSGNTPTPQASLPALPKASPKASPRATPEASPARRLRPESRTGGPAAPASSPSTSFALDVIDQAPAHPGALACRSVTGLVPPHQRVASRSWLARLTPLAAVAGAAACYAWASGVDPAHYEERAPWMPHLLNTLAGVAGSLVGALAPTALAWTRHALRVQQEQRLQQQPAYETPAARLDRMAELALRDGPLTRAGLLACIARMQALVGEEPGEPSHLDLALAFARLSLLAPVGGSVLGCQGGGHEPLAVVGDGIARLWRERQLSLDEFKQALLALVTLRAPIHRLGPPEAETLAAYLMTLFRTEVLTPQRGGVEDAADFLCLLRALPAFGHHGARLDALAAEHLDLDPTTLSESQVSSPLDRTDEVASNHAGSRADPALRLLERYPPARPLTREGLHRLVLAVARGELASSTALSLRHLDLRLQQPSADPTLDRACLRARFLVNHWQREVLAGRSESLGSGATPAAEPAQSQAQADVVRQLAGLERRVGGHAIYDRGAWQDASLLELAALARLAGLARHDAHLQDLSRALTQLDALAERLVQAPLGHLREATGAAIGIVMGEARGSARKLACGMLAILLGLEHRRDLPPGAFSGGLLRRDQVETLILHFAPDVGERDRSWVYTLAELPRLCQALATPSLVRRASERLETLLIRDSQESEETLPERTALLAKARQRLLSFAEQRVAPNRAIETGGRRFTFPWMTAQFRAKVLRG